MVTPSNTTETDMLVGTIDPSVLEHDAYATMTNHAIKLERERNDARKTAHETQCLLADLKDKLLDIRKFLNHRPGSLLIKQIVDEAIQLASRAPSPR